MALQVLLLARLPVWSWAGDLGLDAGKGRGVLSPGRTTLPPTHYMSSPDGEIPQCLQLCCWAQHQAS